jgi:hypothetical protein
MHTYIYTYIMVVNVKEFTHAFLNETLANNFVRMFIMLLCGVFIGYTLQPVPHWLSNLFDTSNLLKFSVLLFAGITAVYPLDGDEIYYIVFGSLFILILFNIFRNYDKKKN